jgi:hypothetical protein
VLHTYSRTWNWSCFKEHEGEPFWSVFEARVRNRFPPPTSLKKLEDVLPEEWYKIQLETVQNLYESIPRRIMAVLKA